MNKKIKILTSFLETLHIDGVCSFWIEEDEDENEKINVYLILDIDWLNSRVRVDSDVPPEQVKMHLAKRIRNKVQTEIFKWFDSDVFVGSTARKCK